VGEALDDSVSLKRIGDRRRHRRTQAFVDAISECYNIKRAAP